jgi:hypothetical protein
VARGWESKGVEDQQQAAEDRANAAKRAQISSDQAEVDRKRDSFLLQRTRVLREIEASSSDRHRQTLAGGLQYLDQQLADLGWKNSVE